MCRNSNDKFPVIGVRGRKANSLAKATRIRTHPLPGR
ncbi:hypothetical protein ES708_13398 [subsurface metagenome]